NMFLIALIVVFTFPFLFKLLPKENNKNKDHLDFVGLIIVATIATTVMLFITNFNWVYMIGALIAIIVCALYIKVAHRPVVT
ncbi:hypothetical protein Q0O45_13580, partial [Staphylococcus aureus]|nr:hypothetical protein [Staphylococcus aureus]